jgi:hypothetical protein
VLKAERIWRELEENGIKEILIKILISALICKNIKNKKKEKQTRIAIIKEIDHNNLINFSKICIISMLNQMLYLN